MALQWKDVITSPKYQEYSPEKKRETRDRFFNEVVKPQIDPAQADKIYSEFNAGADKMEGVESKIIKAPTENNPPVKVEGYSPEELASMRPLLTNVENTNSVTLPSSIDEAIKQQQRGKGNAFLRGRYGSTTAKLVKNYAPDTASGKGIKQFEESGYQPEGMGEEVAYEAGKIISDLPLYALGGKIGGAFGAFGLPAGLDKTMEIKERNGGKIPLTVENVADPVVETLKGGATGWATAAAGLLGKPVANVLAKPGITNKIIDAGISTVAEGTALLGSDMILNGKGFNDLTAKDAVKTAILIGMMKLPHVAGGIKEAAASKGIPEERITQNIKPEHIEYMKDPAASKYIIDEAVVKTERQIEAERVSNIQNEIVNRQIKANYKEGKSPEQIIQPNQIPKEYRPYVLDQTEAGGFKFKPEVIEKVNEHINGIKNNPFAEQEVPGSPLFDSKLRAQRGEELAGKLEEVRQLTDAAKENLSKFNEYKQELQHKYMKEELNKLTGNYRRYEHQPQIRDRMDQVIDYAMSVMTPEERFKVAQDPTSLLDHIDSKESGYTTLKKPYQEAVQREIVAKVIQETNYIPPHVIEHASRKAQFQIDREGKSFSKKVLQAEEQFKGIESQSEYIEYRNKLIEESKSPYIRQKEILPKLEEIDQQAIDAKVKNQVLLQKAMGESLDLGKMSRSNAEYYGKEHFNDLMEFAVKTPEEINRTFEGANHLEREFKQKGASPDLFLNKSRFIANKLGQKVYKNFVVPLRQAEHNFVIESQRYKDWIKDYKKQFSSHDRDVIGQHLIGQMEQGQATFAEINRKVIEAQRPKDFYKRPLKEQEMIDRVITQKLRNKGKLVEPKKFEELTPEQQAAVTEIRKVLDVMYERINAAREVAGLDKIEKVDDYFTFMRKFSLLEELGYDLTKIPAEDFYRTSITDFKTRGLSFQYGKERVQSTRDLETDAFYVMDKYLTTALRTAHMTPVIGKLRDGLDVNSRFAEVNPYAHKYLHDTLDYVSGKKISEAADWINTMANKVNRNIGIFILTYNAKSMAVQPSAVVNTIGVLGPRAVGKGLMDFMRPDMQKFALENSKVLKARMHDITVEEMTKGLTGKLGRAKETAASIGTLPLRYLDLKTAQISWLSAYRYGQDVCKLSPKEAILFADDTVINSQGSAARIDLAPIQHTPLGKSLTLFNTFVINNLNFLADDIMGIRKTNRLKAEGLDRSNVESLDKNQFARLNADGKFNVYERGKLLPTSKAIENVVTFAAASFVCNTIYELAGTKSPMPAPLSAAYEGFTGQSWVDALQGKEATKREGQLAGAFMETLKEFLSMMPVSGGSFRYGGGSWMGATTGHIYDSLQTFSGQPGSKPALYIAAKWLGMPGGQQMYKIFKQLSKERREDQQEARRMMHPGETMRREMQKNNPYYQMKKEMRKEMRGY